MKALREGLAALWCEWTHGGGYILRDPSGRVNWQCSKCGRWAQPVSETDEANLLRQHEIAQAMRDVGRRVGH